MDELKTRLIWGGSCAAVLAFAVWYCASPASFLLRDALILGAGFGAMAGMGRGD